MVKSFSYSSLRNTFKPCPSFRTKNTRVCHNRILANGENHTRIECTVGTNSRMAVRTTLSCSPSSMYLDSSDYHAALLRTTNAYIAPTQGKLLNYVQRVPLGVVAQITVSLIIFLFPAGTSYGSLSSHSTTPSLLLSRRLPRHWQLGIVSL